MTTAGYLTTQDLSQRLGVSLSTVYRLITAPDGPPALRAGRKILFDPGEIDAWLRREVRKPMAEPTQAA